MRKFLVIGFFGLSSTFGLFFCGVHELGLSEAKMVEALQEALVLGSKTAAFNLGDSTCASDLASAGECATGYLGNKLVEIAVPDTVKNVLSQISSFTNKLDNLNMPPAIAAAFNTSLNAYLGSSSALMKPSLDAQSAAISIGALSSLGGYADDIKKALNRGAEQAAPASVDVFKSAIFGMSFSDAKGVLLGESSAATSYLHNVTYNGLQIAFKPLIKEPLDLLNPNKYWKPIASNYNSFKTAYSSTLSSSALQGAISLHNNLASNSNKFNISSLPRLPYSDADLPDDLSSYLSEYATGKALDGLFFMVGKQEASLRADPWGTVSAVGSFISDTVGELLGSVFSKAKDDDL
ncbi:MAG: DUF4197 domain-containing protein [Fibromonadaceae bacterium]|nr:DUF4197 domain-containing protein [Fibromonadaceae bacterium]